MGYSDNEFDVIVVGAGVVGSSTVYQLTKRGQKTLLLERFDFLHHQSSSHGESRTIQATYLEDYYLGLVDESYRLWEAQHFDMGPSDAKSLLFVLATCRKNTIPYQVLDHRQVAKRFSRQIDIPEPTNAVLMFQMLAFKNGACLKDNTTLVSINKDGDQGLKVAASNGEIFWGKKYVVVVGDWMRNLVKTVCGIELPIQPLEANVCYWRIKDGHEVEYAIGNNFSMFTSYGHSYIFGTPSLEYPGLIKVAVHGGYQWKVDLSKPVMIQLCMYLMTPNEDFMIAFLRGEFRKDVVIEGGFSGHGIKMIARFEENPKGNIKEYEDQVGLLKTSL
ncbi:hypothetical protein ES319_D06G123300v1 [Gossypium barbadense]|uniref:FAD dependent oxidoreductase domain-containing protein n=1 Tax=Gossypium barbadense TaxID=3634 RepID=A0A5J5R2I7_GOSBA|nr:hypothetical protein ES319_D06G123300v1 [Gossypium barbadense]